MNMTKKNIKKLAVIIFTATFIMAFIGCASETKSEKPVMEVIPAEAATLADKNAIPNTQLVMNYLASIYGKRMLTGMMDNAWSNTIDMDEKVFKDTGYHSALMGFDFMELTKPDSKGWYHPNQIEKAIDFWYKGSLITFCWHWFDPSAEKAQGASFRPEDIKFRIPYDKENNCLDTKSEDFKYIKKDLDTVARYLNLLQSENIVVLWRPLHEAKGNYGLYGGAGKAWFWWGSSGPDAYKALWTYMFDYFTNEKNLHNLIWVWNGQGAEWYPGDDYCDIAGYDIYDDRNKNGPGTSYYNNLIEWSNGTKMTAISECSYVPSSPMLQTSPAKWLYYMIWNDNDNLMDDSKTDKDNFWGGQKYNSIEQKTTYGFDTDFQIKRGDKELVKLFKDMGFNVIE